MGRSVTLVLMAMLSGCHAASNSAAPDYDWKPVEATIQGWIDAGYYPGAAILVAKDDRVLIERYFGNYTPETVVFLASAGKWLAAATIAAVVDEGKMSWDDRAGKWVPELRADPKGRATLRQLLSHTAGYPAYQPKDKPRDAYQTLAESVTHLAPLPPESEPGAKFEYGGLAMQVAGRMTEIATGKDWETLFQEKIARPLGMTEIHFTPVDQGGGHSPMLGGGARGTLRDYALFLRMIHNSGIHEGRRVLSEQSVREMQADQVRGAKVEAGKEFVERARGQKHNGIYGLGEWREMLDENGNAVLLSSPSWAGTYPWIDKSRNVYGVFLTHVEGLAAGRDQFSSFYSSPPLAMIVRQVIDQRGKQR